MMGRISTFLYGIVCYLIFFVSFLWAIPFLCDVGLTRSIDSGPQGPIGQALVIDAALLTLFALQHSIMARPWFKRAWTRIVPPAAERSTYVLFSSVALIVLFYEWRPIGGTIWQVDAGAARDLIYAIYAAGWALLLVATFLINHFDLFGLRQVYLHLRGRQYTQLPFRTPALYRYVRHPIYFSWACIFWATPHMTTAHLLFAIATTAYMLAAIPLEERDLVSIHGDEYRRYKQEVPKIVPLRFPGKQHAVAPVAAIKSRAAGL
jgi:methanethiol S-methyltransferase